MLNKEHHLLVPFVTHPWKSFTFRQVKELTKKKSKSYVLSILKKFVREKILLEEKIGNLNLYTLNISVLNAQVYAGFVAEHLGWNKPNLPYKNLHKLAEQMPTAFYVLIITGSYARSTQKETSDLDVVLIVDDTEKIKKVYAELRQMCELSVPEIHLYVFKKSEFLEMLINKEANYGKEIAKNNLLLYSGAAYYQILNEAIEHGFNDKSLS